MSRSLGLRLPDAQYDWLVERAICFEGDLSEATRDAIDAAGSCTTSWARLTPTRSSRPC